MSMKFEYQFDDGMTKVTLELPSDSNLDEVLSQFENFLKACGYSFDGVLDFHYDAVDTIEENPDVRN